MDTSQPERRTRLPLYVAIVSDVVQLVAVLVVGSIWVGRIDARVDNLERRDAQAEAARLEMKADIAAAMSALKSDTLAAMADLRRVVERVDDKTTYLVQQKRQ